MTKYINAVYNTPYQLKLPVEIEKLKKYAKHISICGESRNSYSKSDNDATFMRVKKDYMGNDQLLPGYNVQLGICDEYIAVFDTKQYASDTDCFQPLMEKFNKTYGKYPMYPVAETSIHNEVLSNLNSTQGALL